jgi:hypothetical protein
MRKEGQDHVLEFPQKATGFMNLERQQAGFIHIRSFTDKEQRPKLGNGGL